MTEESLKYTEGNENNLQLKNVLNGNSKAVIEFVYYEELKKTDSKHKEKLSSSILSDGEEPGMLKEVISPVYILL